MPALDEGWQVIALQLIAERQQAKAYRQLEDYYRRIARTHVSYEYARNWLKGKHMTMEDKMRAADAAAPEDGDPPKKNTEKKHESLPVKGYKPQGERAVALVNAFKEHEERLLRILDHLKLDTKEIDQRWLAIGRTSLEQAFMAINRSVFAPKRVQLPGDAVPDAADVRQST